MRGPSIFTSLAGFLAIVAACGFISPRLGASAQTQALLLGLLCWLYLGFLGAQAQWERGGNFALGASSSRFCSGRSACWWPTIRAVESARRAGAAACIGTLRGARNAVRRSDRGFRERARVSTPGICGRASSLHRVCRITRRTRLMRERQRVLRSQGCRRRRQSSSFSPRATPPRVTSVDHAPPVIRTRPSRRCVVERPSCRKRIDHRTVTK
jgi:hypothetical protein